MRLGALLGVLGLLALVLGRIVAYRTPQEERFNFGSAALFDTGLLFLALAALVILADVLRRRGR